MWPSLRWALEEDWTVPTSSSPICASSPTSASTTYNFWAIRWQRLLPKSRYHQKGVPVIIGESTPETRPVFQAKAEAVGAPIVFAEDEHLLLSATRNEAMHYVYQTADYANLEGELGGLCQLKNTNTLLSAIRRLSDAGYRLTEENVREGFLHVCELTGLMGRWQKLGEHPTIICDTGHNVGGIQYITEQLKTNPIRPYILSLEW